MTRLLLGAVLLLLEACVCVPLQGNQVPAVLAPPAQVRFDSTDYRNILQWTPPTNSSSLQYYVQWKIYGEVEWLDMDGCQGIQKHQCDLSSVTSDLREWYYARVHASSSPSSSKSAWALSPRFSPRRDTKISPPGLRVNNTVHGLVVRVRNPRPMVRKMHSSLVFKIYVIQPSGEEELFEMDCCSLSNKLTLKNLKPNTEYCLQAQTTIPQQAKTSARSSKTCITTP